MYYTEWKLKNQKKTGEAWERGCRTGIVVVPCLFVAIGIALATCHAHMCTRGPSACNIIQSNKKVDVGVILYLNASYMPMVNVPVRGALSVNHLIYPASLSGAVLFAGC